ncbi:LpxI family protein [Fusobacterium sp. PH5-44]|uniref:LpxI family protein n=1 Tax=unclassified Fusobacterium TaxID=2648384 RepID=UPI003D2427A6
MEKIGIFVGMGKLPLYFLSQINTEKFELFPLGLYDEVEEEIKLHHNYRRFSIGEVGIIIKYLLRNDIKKIIMLGKIEKELIFKNMQLDEIGEKLLKKLPDRKDETLLFGTISFLRLNKIEVLPQTYLMKNFVVKKKCYTIQEPDFHDLKTIQLGHEAAKMLSRVDAGQCVICKDRSVVALEGIEGTDKCIERGGKLAGDGTIIVKMSRPQQDMRVDVPTVGIGTLEKAISIKAKGIVCEANKMIFLNEKECIELANENNMFIVGV